MGKATQGTLVCGWTKNFMGSSYQKTPFSVACIVNKNKGHG